MSLKGQVIRAGLVVAIVATLVYVKDYCDQKRTLSQSRTRIDESLRHIEDGRLRARAAVEIDLSSVAQWYSVTAVKTEAAALSEEAGNASAKLALREKTVQGWLEGVSQRLRTGQNLQASDYIDAIQSQYPWGTNLRRPFDLL